MTRSFNFLELAWDEHKFNLCTICKEFPKVSALLLFLLASSLWTLFQSTFLCERLTGKWSPQTQWAKFLPFAFTVVEGIFFSFAIPCASFFFYYKFTETLVLKVKTIWDMQSSKWSLPLRRSFYTTQWSKDILSEKRGQARLIFAHRSHLWANSGYHANKMGTLRLWTNQRINPARAPLVWHLSKTKIQNYLFRTQT